MRWAARLAQPLRDITTETLSWAQIKGTGTTALFGSENVSALTDNGAGDYTVTWAVPYASASSYAVCMGTSGSAALVTQHFRAFQSITASSIRTSLLDFNSAGATDPEFAYLIAVGEF